MKRTRRLTAFLSAISVAMLVSASMARGRTVPPHPDPSGAAAGSQLGHGSRPRARLLRAGGGGGRTGSGAADPLGPGVDPGRRGRNGQCLGRRRSATGGPGHRYAAGGDLPQQVAAVPDRGQIGHSHPGGSRRPKLRSRAHRQPRPFAERESAGRRGGRHGYARSGHPGPAVRACPSARSRADLCDHHVDRGMAVDPRQNRAVRAGPAGRLLRCCAGGQQGQRGVRGCALLPARRGGGGGARVGQDLA